ncbi:TPA: hypothetical protein MOX26_000715 [Salmonella enterica subsp. enterica serovar Ball]|uniref:Uncharacterized protein n=1 Tax=Salmonella muenster TaxID=82689 RepID=A0A5J2RZ35_SALMS|nr:MULTISPECIES: hypothetical protein [Salmonella]EAA2704811.1 hypothetical protein [Salmonella enterica subsp. enterica serovar Saintpaul]EBJ5981543.1 hypothetical protein [Salmonella enterica subsp. enterica serovar Muenster]EBR8137426.1 hypothetical protein [Salmonella enterica subsp. enterica serovar Oranienburg]EBR8549318.1 hypothetical protein [Salmonella enterica subsp. enterica serovar Bareilly]EBV1689694.1 hypothetical protein [Salmonella enterica subsp. enterica serovar Newport]EBV6
MFENYAYATKEERNRGEIVKAALEIVKASVSASSSYTGRDKLEKDIKFVVANIESLADAIENAMKDK